jgi:SAM-dependent methyltransferase
MGRGSLSSRDLQQDYYSRTAHSYDAMHSGEDEHAFALRFLSNAIDQFEARSVLDVGSGTGRVITYLMDANPEVRAVGVEPVAQLRDVGHGKGIPSDHLVEGDATALPYEDNSFDLVTAFAVMHHLPDPGRAVSEMLRVARLGVFISDGNNYGQGGPGTRKLKSSLRALRLWHGVVRIKTRGRGYHVSDGDGLFYPYSVVDSCRQLREACTKLYLFNTSDSGSVNANLVGSAPTLGILALK